jgi:hypothetical protein
VVVDGAPRPGTVLTLSHWPGTPTPPALWDDVSAGIVLRALSKPRLLRAATAATVDHYDADGVIALAMLVHPGLAERHAGLLVRAARAGDFDLVADGPAAKVAFALEALTNAERALAVLPELVERPDAFDELWGPEWAAYQASCRMLADGAVTVEERPALDLAVVRVDPGHPAADAARWRDDVVHRAVSAGATGCLRVATLWGRHAEVRFRYETWVRLASRRPRLRVDLAPLAAALGDLETDGGGWVFDGAGAITPRLCRADGAESTVAPERFLAELCAALEAGDRLPPAWDPYARPAATVPVA